ncbi:hypothetical protein SeLEV6574_g05635 [Synchytrium endobioticum]|uniref:Uncharacterized protein n=1 Tax=Synchytrium endobioticum TaxID=286115 RepID=A0A507CTE5_9FUNG|nr:hypothetical protein SeLEV6574_g05635 [Synchytrium endobioticum]
MGADATDDPPPPYATVADTLRGLRTLPPSELTLVLALLFQTMPLEAKTSTCDILYASCAGHERDALIRQLMHADVHTSPRPDDDDDDDDDDHTDPRPMGPRVLVDAESTLSVPGVRATTLGSYRAHARRPPDVEEQVLRVLGDAVARAEASVAARLPAPPHPADADADADAGHGDAGDAVWQLR